MKISITSEPLRPDRVSPSNQEARAAGSRPAEPVAEAEKVQLSELAAHLNQLERQLAQPDVDVKKVEEVRAAIAEGRFRVNADAVADKLLASVAELLGKRS